MQAPANRPEFKETVDPAIEELNRIVEQAEALLRSLGSETSDAAEAVRERVTQTLQQAQARLATTASEAEQVAVNPSRIAPMIMSAATPGRRWPSPHC